MCTHHRLLVVEDHAGTRHMLAKLLRKQGYEVVAAASVAEAERAANELPFDACIADVSLGDGSGFDLMRELNSRHGIKCIACTGHGLEGDIEKGMSAGFVEYLVKPIDFRMMLQILCRIIGDGTTAPSESTARFEVSSPSESRRI